MIFITIFTDFDAVNIFMTILIIISEYVFGMNLVTLIFITILILPNGFHCIHGETEKPYRQQTLMLPESRLNSKIFHKP